MSIKIKLPSLALPILVFLGACASSKEMVEVPDSRPGDTLQADYFLGTWCNNRELTSKANSAAGHSALANLGKIFWKFDDGGKWKASGTGWMYALNGQWQLQPPNRLMLDPARGKPEIYEAGFKNSGIDLLLKDNNGQFLVLSRCN